MKTDGVTETEEPIGPALQCQAQPPHRILVVDDESLMRHLNSKMLIDAGYQVDTAEDGAVAWDTLQVKSYDLVVTDQNMPKISGVELIGKIHAARIPLPVIMATGSLPSEEFARSPHLKPAATLIKPYTLKEFLGTVKTVLCATLSIALLLSCLDMAVNAQGVKASQDSDAPPTVVTISVLGKCECSEDGVTFTNLDYGHIFEQGAIIRTGDQAQTDLFFRRTGTTVRLQADTEIKLEKMTRTVKDGLPVVYTLLDLRAGRIFTVVRSEVAGSTLEIRNAAGRSVVEGSGIGRYIITADGTHVAAIGSVIPIKLMGENGITIIAAGEQFTKKDGKMLSASPPPFVKDLIELDELQTVTDKFTSTKPAP